MRCRLFDNLVVFHPDKMRKYDTLRYVRGDMDYSRLSSAAQQMRNVLYVTLAVSFPRSLISVSKVVAVFFTYSPKCIRRPMHNKLLKWHLYNTIPYELH